MENENNKKSNLPILMSALFILFSLGVIMFLYYQNQTLKKELVQFKASPTPQPTTSPKTTPSPDWKTYTDTKYNFSISYPANFNIFNDEKHTKDTFIGKSEALIITAKSQEEYDNSFTDRSGTFGLFASSINTTPTNLDATSYKTEKVKLLGYDATKITVISDKYGSGSVSYYLTKNGKTFSFYFPATDLRGSHDVIYDQILESFKFLEASPTPKAVATP